MKHKVTIKVEKKKHFLGIPYTVTEKQRVTVDGKTYRKMQKDARDCERAEKEKLAEMAVVGEYLMWEEELSDLLDK